MKCPRCNYRPDIIETRHRTDGSIYRRYECKACLHRYSTKEELTPMVAAHNEHGLELVKKK